MKEDFESAGGVGSSGALLDPSKRQSVVFYYKHIGGPVVAVAHIQEVKVNKLVGSIRMNWINHAPRNAMTTGGGYEPKTWVDKGGDVAFLVHLWEVWFDIGNGCRSSTMSSAAGVAAKTEAELEMGCYFGNPDSSFGQIVQTAEEID